MKIGRNKPCPCGRGKKYKHCCGSFGAQPDIMAVDEVRAMLEQRAAQERIREAQQGRGKPIISTKFKDHQIVAVGNTLHYSPKWKTFADFLSDYIKIKLTSSWGNDELKKPLTERHTIMQWYDVLCRYEAVTIKQSGEPTSLQINGVVACYLGLAYSLYLLDHNVELQKRMIMRLRDQSNFQGAYYELLVARALISAGFELTLEDECDRSSKHCEFAAISKDTGQKYSIEAKMRSVAGVLGKTEKDGASARKAGKPTSMLIQHLNSALEKPAADQRMIFIELNAEMSADVSEENRPTFVAAVNKRLQRYERDELKDDKSAYIFVTNMTAHRDMFGLAQILVIPTSVGIRDFNRSGFYKLSDIYRNEKKHADALRVGESISNLLSFPPTFDGSLPSTAFEDELPPIQIGQTTVLRVPGQMEGI